jgi:hypothetical protein
VGLERMPRALAIVACTRFGDAAAIIVEGIS